MHNGWKRIKYLAISRLGWVVVVSGFANWLVRLKCSESASPFDNAISMLAEHSCSASDAPPICNHWLVLAFSVLAFSVLAFSVLTNRHVPSKLPKQNAAAKQIEVHQDHHEPRLEQHMLQHDEGGCHTTNYKTRHGMQLDNQLNSTRSAGSGMNGSWHVRWLLRMSIFFNC